MRGNVFIDTDAIGHADFTVIDESMGGIGGIFHPNDNYKKYQQRIQALYELNGIANIVDFNFSIVLIDGTVVNDPYGGIGITDCLGIDEIYVESAGVDREIVEKLKST